MPWHPATCCRSAVLIALALPLFAQDAPPELPRPAPNAAVPDTAALLRLARELCTAIDRGDAAAVGKALAAGADPDAGMGAGENTTAGRTPLIHAVLGGKVALLDLLVAAGADLDATDDGGHTPLMYAARVGNTALVEHLLRLGARPDLAADDGSTVVDHAADSATALREMLVKAVAAHADLVAALQVDDIDAMRRAFAAGASPNGHDGAMSPLLWAVHADHDTLVPELLAKGARNDLAHRAGFAFATALGAAAGTANFDRLQQLLAAGKPNQQALDHALAMAAARATDDRLQFVQRLLEAGARPVGNPQLAVPALAAAAAYADFATMRVLLRAGADEAAVDRALIVAAGLTDDAQATAVVRALLAIGANPNEPYLFASALGAAAARGATTILELLLPQCDRDAVNLAVVETTRADHAEGLRWLCAHKAEWLDFAAAPGTFDPAVVEAAATGRLACLEVLLTAGADPNLPPGTHHDTPLIAAVRVGQREAVERLLRAGADPVRRWQAPLRGTQSAIDAARELGLGELVELLRQSRDPASADGLFASLQAAGLAYTDTGDLVRLRYEDAKTQRSHAVYVRKHVTAFHSLRGREVFGLVYDAATAPSDELVQSVFQKRFGIGHLVFEAPSPQQANWRIRFRVTAAVDATPERLAQYLQIVQSTADKLEQELAPEAKDRL